MKGSVYSSFAFLSFPTIWNWNLSVIINIGYVLMSVKDCKGYELIPHLQANKLTCHSLMDASRSHETLWSEMKNNALLTIAVAM